MEHSELRARLRPPPVAAAPPLPPDDDASKQHRRPLLGAQKLRKQLGRVADTELHPKLLLQWHGQFAQSVRRAAVSLSSVRQAKFNDFISGLVESCLLFTFASVFASSIFSEVGIEYVALGTGCTLITTTIVQASFTLFSDCPLTIGGPEITPTIFLTTMANLAKKKMQRNNVGEINTDHLLTTVLAIIILSSCIFGAFMYLLGRLKISKLIRLVPACVLSGYMASIGYLVFVKSMSTSMPYKVYNAGPSHAMFWAYFIPALAIGVIMYLQRRWKVGNPTVVLPILLFSPLILFYVCVYATGSNIEQAAVDGWLFPAFDTGLFHDQLTKSYGNAHNVDWSAVGETVPTMITMLFVIALESTLKQVTTKKLLKQYDMRIDHELMLLGKANIVTGLLAGVPGYPQPKLTYVSQSLVRNTTTRVPGVIVSVVAAIIFFSGFPLINYLPRMWLSGVLIFAAAGFLVENIWDQFFVISFKEYGVIVLIVVVNATVSMVAAVLAGIVLAALIFALTYSLQDVIKSVITGAEWSSNILRPPTEEGKLAHLGKRVLILQLHRFVFFGNASFLSEVVSGLVKEQQTTLPPHQRATHFVFDWSRVENVDITAGGVIYELVTKMHGHVVIFSGLDAKKRRKLADSVKLLGKDGAFATLDEAMEHVEEQLLLRSQETRLRWLSSSSSSSTFEDFSVRAKHKNNGLALLWEELDEYFCHYLQVPQDWSLVRQGERDDTLYVLREGSLSVLGGNGHAGCVQRLKPGAFVNENVLCRRQALALHTVVADVDSMVLTLNAKEQHNLELTRPALAFALHRHVEDYLLRVKRKNTARLDVMNLWELEKAEAAAAAAEAAEEEEHGGVAPEGDEEVARSPALSAVSSPLQQPAASSPQVTFSLADDPPHMDGEGDVEAQHFTPPASVMSRLRRQVSFATGAALGTTTTPTGAGAAAVEDAASPSRLRKQMSSLAQFTGGDGMTPAEQDETMQMSSGSGIAPATAGIEGVDHVYDRLRDDAGEEEGMRLARRLMRRQSSTTTLTQTSSTAAAGAAGAKAVGLKLLKSDQVLAAILRRLALMPASASSSRQQQQQFHDVYYHLCPTFAAQARVAFGLHAQRKGDDASAALELPRSKLKATLNSIGVCYHGEDEGRAFSGGGGLFFADEGAKEEEDGEAGEVHHSLAYFLDLVVELTMPPLPPAQVDKLHAFCNKSGGDRLTELELQKALPYTNAHTVSKFVTLWDEDRTRCVDFASLCSAMAKFQAELDCNAAVHREWRDMLAGVSGGGGVAEDGKMDAAQVAKAFGVDPAVAQEMVWDADAAGEGAISLPVLLDALSSL